MRMVFMGTAEFAVPILAALIEHAAPGQLVTDGLDIVAVVTRQDKPAGRGRPIVSAPIKQYALAHGLPVWQPGSLRRAENQEALRQLAPDIIIVVAFGQILPEEVLKLPRYGCLNVHASLLPRHRGAAPISAAILAGDPETGVSIMLMDTGIDTGPVLAQRTLPIAPDDTTETLTPRLAQLGADLLIETLPRWFKGEIEPQPQDESRATAAPMLTKAQGRIDWSQPAELIARQVRAYQPWPGASTTWRGRLLKIRRAQALPIDFDRARELPPGKVTMTPSPEGKALVVACGAGALRLEVVQLEGKRAVSTDEFLRGYPGIVGETLGAA
jgi:methionyl-tRNA formyltransferase